MIKELKEEITNIFKRDKKIISSLFIEKIIIYIIYLKYLCEIKKYEYERVINSNEIYDIIDISPFFKVKINDYSIDINSLLRNYTGVNAKVMLLDYLKGYQDEINMELVNDKKLTYINDYTYLFNSTLFGIYDIYGKTIYIKNNNINKFLKIFKIFDEILDIKNEYKDIEEIDFTSYNNLCIYDYSPKYMQNESKLYGFIFDKIHDVENIYLFSNSSNVSNFKNGKIVLRYIKTILIKKDMITIIFNQNSTDISIINCNNPKISNISELKDILEKNHKQKDILVKTNYHEIRKNNMRIGFNLYQMEKDNSKININQIVDENTNYLNRLNTLNEIVEKETNKIFNL